jgi:putative ABC transport system permease protein
MDTFIQDLRYGIRTLAKSPGFAAAGILTLALGIGATTAMVSAVDAVLVKPLPYKDPERIVALWEKTPAGQRNSVSSAEFIDWKNQNQVFDCLVALDSGMFNLSDRNQPEQVLGILATADLFQVLGVNPSLGRGFLPDDENPGRDKVVVLGHGLWQRRFGSDRNIVGGSIRLNNEKYTVIGVMPPVFRFLSTRADLWMPLVLEPSQLNRRMHYLSVYGRLKPAAELNDAQADMDVIAGNLDREYPESHMKNWGALVVPLRDQVVTADLRQSLLIFLAAVSFVLLIACANVANLTLARGATRFREISIRAALGAGRFRLVRQLLTESVALSLLGGILGLFLSFWLVSLSATFIPRDTLPSEAQITVNFRVLFFATVTSLLTGILFGLAPSQSLAKTNLTGFLKEGSKAASMSFRRSGLRSTLVISEVGLAVMLLVGAGLLIRSLRLLQQVQPGFVANNVLTLELTLPETQYSDSNKITNFYQKVIDRVKSFPGVEEVAMVTEPPLAGSGFWIFFTIEGHPTLSISEQPTTNFQIVSPSYFSTLSIPLLKGRDFTEHDTQDTTHVAIINQTLSRKFSPNEDPVGKRINIESRVPGQHALGPATLREIVGVVGDVKVSRLGEQSANCEVYVPHSQNPWTSMCLVVRTGNNLMLTVNSVKAAVLDIDKTQPVTNIRSMNQIVVESLSEPRFRTLVLSLFSIVALLLSAVGIFGVMSYAVSQRTREIGIRMALGANRREVLRLIVKQGMVLAVLGWAAGGLASLVVTRALSSFLFGVGTADASTFFEMSLVLLVVSFLACYFPARRATKVDPIVALRYE